MDPAPDRPPTERPADPDLDALATRLADRVAEMVDEARQPPPLLDLAGVARRLNVSERTVENIVAAGELPVVRLGTGTRRGLRRFDPAAVEAYIRRQARSL